MLHIKLKYCFAFPCVASLLYFFFWSFRTNHLFLKAMKFTTQSILALLAIGGSDAFSPNVGAPCSHSSRAPTSVKTAVGETIISSETKSGGSTRDPLLIRAAKGEKVERTPVWMMRQAGRHIKEYRDLCKTYPTFRQRSEIPEVAVEVSLQPWRNYQTDGCILFSDILTPLPGVGCDFTIDEKLGPIMDPIKNWDDAKKVSRQRSPLWGGVLRSMLTFLSFSFGRFIR
jgi:hypothetical protein